MNPASDHLIVIPVYNEAATIGGIVRGAARHGDVLVIDDGSTDGSGNGDPGVDDWERALLGRELERALLPPRSLAARFGQHGGLGALRVAAAALEAGRGEPTVLVHGIARGGCRTALLVEAAP